MPGPTDPMDPPALGANLGANARAAALTYAWESFKALYRTVIASQVRAWRRYYDTVEEAATCGQQYDTGYLAKLYAAYDALGASVSQARSCGRLVWGDDAEERLYSAIRAEVNAATREQRA